MIDRFAIRIEGIVEEIGDALMRAPVLNCDETGVRTAGTSYWLHNASTSELTFQTVEKSRGEEGMRQAGLLPFYPGIKFMIVGNRTGIFRASTVCATRILFEKRKGSRKMTRPRSGRIK